MKLCSELSVPTQPPELQPMGRLRPSPCGETQNALLPVAVRSTPSPSQLSRLLCWLDTGSGSWVVLVPLDRLSVGGTGCSSGSGAGAWTIAGASSGAEVTCKERRQMSQEGERPWALSVSSLLWPDLSGGSAVQLSWHDSKDCRLSLSGQDPQAYTGHCNTMCVYLLTS